MNASQMLAQPRKAYLLLHAEMDLDTADPRAARAAMQSAELVVAMAPFRHALEYAQVLLPVSPFTETGGSFVNTEGRVQSFQGVVRPLGETRPAWKVLRVLGTLLELPGFEYDSVEGVRAECVAAIGDMAARLDNAIHGEPGPSSRISRGAGDRWKAGIERIGKCRSITSTDRASCRILAADPRCASRHRVAARTPGPRSSACARTTVCAFSSTAAKPFCPSLRDDRLPANCARIPAGCLRDQRAGAIVR